MDKPPLTIMVFPDKYFLRTWNALEETFVWSKPTPLPEGPRALEELRESLEVITELPVSIDLSQAAKELLEGQMELPLDDPDSPYWGKRVFLD